MTDPQVILKAVAGHKLPPGNNKPTFWKTSEKGRITINRDELMDFLYIQGGFAIYYFDPGVNIYRIVQNRNGFLREVGTEQIKKFLKAYLKTDYPAVLSLVMEKADNLIGKSALEFLPHGKYDFLKDTKTEAFFTFKNGVVKVEAGSFKLLTYKELNKVIWETQIIDFDIEIEDIKGLPIEFFEFIRLLCSENEDRVCYATTLIGYLLHKFKDPTRPWAVVLAEETEDEKNGGGTGKGLFFKAISKLTNTVTMDGKMFTADKSFAYQRINLDTRLMVIEDTPKNVDFEKFYSIITEGIPVEKKNLPEFYIPYCDSPKIGFTTNYSVKAIGGHGQRRQKVFEFGPFFKAGYSPEDHFKHQMFHDWDQKEWSLFYNFMFLCVQAYLESGLKETKPSETMKRKQLRLSFGEEFVDWWFDFIEIKQNFGHPIMQKYLYDCFLKEASLMEKDYSYRRFKYGMKSGMDVVCISGMFKKSSQAGGAMMVTFTR